MHVSNPHILRHSSDFPLYRKVWGIYFDNWAYFESSIDPVISDLNEIYGSNAITI